MSVISISQTFYQIDAVPKLSQLSTISAACPSCRQKSTTSCDLLASRLPLVHAYVYIPFSTDVYVSSLYLLTCTNIYLLIRVSKHLINCILRACKVLCSISNYQV